MLSQPVRRILNILLHLVVNILVAVQNVYYQFRNKKCFLAPNVVTKSDIKVVLEHLPRVTKKLKHLVILTDTDHHSFSDLARMVIWSLVAGISYVSFYDITGNILRPKDHSVFLLDFSSYISSNQPIINQELKYKP